MTISFGCEHCGQRYKVDEAHAGKRSQCKKCGQVMVVRAASDAGAYEVAGDLAEVRPPRAPASVPRDDLEPVVLERVGPRAARTPWYWLGTSGPVLHRTPVLVGGYGVALALILLPLALFDRTIGFTAAGGTFFLAAALLILMGNLGMVIMPFCESAGCGFLNLFVPFYSLYYLCTRWARTGRWFLTQLAGAGLMTLGLIVMVVLASTLAAPTKGAGPTASPGFAMPPPRALAGNGRAGRPAASRPGLNPARPPQPGLVSTPDAAPGGGAPRNEDETLALNKSVALVFTPVGGEVEEQALRDRLAGLRGPDGRRLSHQSRTTGSSVVVKVWPVESPEAFFSQLDWLERSRTHGRTAYVTLRPIDPADARPPESDVVGQALFDLKGKDDDRRHVALGKLRRPHDGVDRAVEVASAVEALLTDRDPSLRADAARALAFWGGPANTPALCRAVQDPERRVQTAALDTLGKLHDPAAAGAVAALLPTLGSRATRALINLGPAAEAAVLPYLDHEDMKVRVEACRALENIGQRLSLTPLKNLSQRGDGTESDALAARRALNVLSSGSNGSAPPGRGIPPTRGTRTKNR